MASHVRLLTAPTADTRGMTVQLHHDEPGTYLFGSLGEGLQRALVQRKFQAARIRQVFLSGPVTWQSIGGLLGLILTIADNRSSSIEQADINTTRGQKTIQKHLGDFVIHGGPNISYALAAARAFIFRKGLPLKLIEARSDPRLDDPNKIEPDYSDPLTKVWYVPLRADGSSESPKSPRKRSHEEMEEGTQLGQASELTDADRRIVDEAVAGMFDPDWSLDKLETTSLRDADANAKLFVRNDHGEMEPYIRSDGDDPNKTVFVRKPWPGAVIRSLPPTIPVRQSMCYIVRNTDRRGKFLAAEALRLGVPRMQNQKLTKGESVVVKDGTTVTPEMVMEPPIAGKGFAVIDLPDESYIPAFLARPEWDNKEIFTNIEKIFWNLGPGLVDDSRIHEFMRKHGGIKHTVGSKEVCPNRFTYTSSSETLTRFHRIDPDRFTIPDFNNVPQQFPPPLTDGSEEKLFQSAVLGETTRLAPRVMDEDKFLEPNVNLEAALEPMSDETIGLAVRAQQKVSDPEFLKAVTEAERDIPNRDMEVISLGTGSALPSKYRNVSGTLLRIPGVGSYLLDCGENTIGTLRRLLGTEGADEVLRDLRAIWISHVHADHHLGTVSVIKAWRDATQHMTPQPRLLLSCGLNMANYFAEYKNVEDFGYDRLVFGIPRNRGDDPHVALPEETDGSPIEMAEFGLKSIGACRVDHCYLACATVFEWPSGLKVAYSGDCRPSENFVELAKGATLLIHEATFEDDLKHEAVNKKHSTVAEALGIGRRMRARRVLLTHFSQRYPKIPIFDTTINDPNDGVVKDKVVILMAFDMMRVKLGEFRQAAQFLEAFRSLFPEELAAELKEHQEKSTIPLADTAIHHKPKPKKFKAPKHKGAMKERRHSPSRVMPGSRKSSPKRDSPKRKNSQVEPKPEDPFADVIHEDDGARGTASF